MSLYNFLFSIGESTTMITKIFHVLNGVLKIHPWLEQEVTKHFLVTVSVSLCVSVYNTKTQPPILGGLAYPLENTTHLL